MKFSFNIFLVQQVGTMNLDGSSYYVLYTNLKGVCYVVTLQVV
jgi:hypothetical protein